MPYLWDPYRHLAAEVRSLYGLLASYSSSPRLEDLHGDEETLRNNLVAHARSFLALIETSGLPVNRHLRNDLESAASGEVDAAVRRSLKLKAALKPANAQEEASLHRSGEAIG